MNRTFFLIMLATGTGASGSADSYVGEPFARLSAWSIGGTAALLLLLSAEAGFLLGRYQVRSSETRSAAPIGEIVGAMLALLGFMLGFTFSLAATRFDARRALVVEEANAIGTTYLRAGLLSEPHSVEIRKLLREYLQARLASIQSGEIAQGIARAEEVQGRLWAEAEMASEKNPGSILAGLFISSLNEVIDLHTKRIAFGLRNHIPTVIWAALCLLAVCTFVMLGYYLGQAGVRKFMVVVPLVLAFSVVLFLIADLDRPQKGLLKVSQRALVELLDKLNAERPESSLPRFSPLLVLNDQSGMAELNSHGNFKAY